jgi:hypothetical protein
MKTEIKSVQKKKKLTFTIAKDNRDEIYFEIDRLMRENRPLPQTLLDEAYKADAWESMKND